MNAKILPFPTISIPSIEHQRQVRESKLVSYLMEEYKDHDFMLVAVAIRKARDALDSDMSAEEAIQAAENVIYPKFSPSVKEKV